MAHIACAARGDNRNADGFADGGSEFAIEAGAGAVGVHGGEKDFAGAALFGFAGPLDDATTSGLAAALNKDFRIAHGIGGIWIAARVDSNDNCLRAEVPADGIDE